MQVSKRLENLIRDTLLGLGWMDIDDTHFLFVLGLIPRDTNVKNLARQRTLERMERRDPRQGKGADQLIHALNPQKRRGIYLMLPTKLSKTIH